MSRHELRALVVVLGSILAFGLWGVACVYGGALNKSDWDVARSQLDNRPTWQRNGQ
jgi:hypothetical protein